jgi:hypothetical protein
MSDGKSSGPGPRQPVGGFGELVKSVLGFSWAMSLFGLRSLGNFADPRRAASSLDAVKQAAAGELGDELRDLLQAGEQLQGNLVDGLLGAAAAGATAMTGGAGATAASPPAGGAARRPGDGSQAPGTAGTPGAPPPPVRSGSLDTATFVALGEGLAAGAADFYTSAELQRDAFPAQMARQMQTGFAQALLQAPGIGNLPGFPPLPVLVPNLMQTTVREPADVATSALGNLAVPGFRLADALHLRPAPPLVRHHDARQTAANLILGMPALAGGARDGAKDGKDRRKDELPTQLEAAVARRPTLALVELGYLEAIEAVVTGDPGRLPVAEAVRRDFGRLLAELRRGGGAVLLMNVPNPLDAACAVILDAAAQVVKVPAAVLASTYGLEPGDRITVRGLVEIGYQFLSQGIGPLPAGTVLPAGVAARIEERIDAINAELAALAGEHGAVLCDLHQLWRDVKAQGVQAGSRQLTGGFLGGFYSLNGYYPGKTGHAAIANLALRQLNQACGAEFPTIDLGSVAATDPVVQYQPAGGPDRGAGPLALPSGAAAATAASSAPAAAMGSAADSPPPVPTASRAGQGGGAWRQPAPWPPPQRPAGPITLPPGMEVVLELNPERSYFGDALRAVDCEDPNDWQFGGCAGVKFGGLGLTDSHLHGQLRIRFAPPIGNLSRFELSVGEGLTGDDGILAAPQFFKLPSQQAKVSDFPGAPSVGWVDLTTGEVVTAVTDPLQPNVLNFNFIFFNTAILALIRVNPNFPLQDPISFPGPAPLYYGSAWAWFYQRPDGQLDFEFFGSTFAPLGGALGGQQVRFPLPFAGGTLEYASIPARGLALHPHIYLSTCAAAPGEVPAEAPEIPTNTVREYTCFTHNTSFGDVFTLNSPVLGGSATGRAQLLGRIQVQFGERAGNSVPIYVSAMIPGGYLAPMPHSPIESNSPGCIGSACEGFPSRLSPGPIGFNEFLHFPNTTYYLDDVFLLSDPFDLSVAALDVRTGAVLGQQLHRGFIGQNVFFALLRVEPRTPKASFQFRGPAVFQRTPSGQTVYRFDGKVHIPYPTTFLFPDPNLATGFPAGPGSALDPYFWVQAMDGGAPPAASFVKEGDVRDVAASNLERFSYSYSIPAEPHRRKAVFEYRNHTLGGSFRLLSLSWVRFGNARTGRDRRRIYDVVTFAGFGTWSPKSGAPIMVPAAAQISTAAGAPYVGIQIAGGAISNVDTKPEDPAAAQP